MSKWVSMDMKSVIGDSSPGRSGSKGISTTRGSGHPSPTPSQGNTIVFIAVYETLRGERVIEALQSR